MVIVAAAPDPLCPGTKDKVQHKQHQYDDDQQFYVSGIHLMSITSTPL